MATRRITPAGAGKTLVFVFLAIANPDHPRRCGENSRNSPPFEHETGSPPQVRGKQLILKIFLCFSGITPAGAGKTEALSASNIAAEDHPRRCGENPATHIRLNYDVGSPPQVRGKLCMGVHRVCAPRITPAGAGKTLKRSFRNQPFCSRAVQISFNFSNSLNVSLQSGSAR